VEHVHRSLRVAWLGAVFLLGWVAELRAQDNGVDAPPSLVAPRLLAPLQVTLPEGVQPPGEPLSLTLTLDAAGVVTDVELGRTLGEEADALIRAAALALLFEPARRDGLPIAAKIRLEVVLDAPEPQPSAAGEAPAATLDAAQPLSAPEPPPIEVPTYGARARVHKPEAGAATQVRLRGNELTMVPGTFGEPLRVVATLPGVARSPFGLGYFLVRGASFQNTGFFVDGFSVPILYHLGAGPAIFSSRLVEQLDFYPGGYPIAYGRYIAGVIALRTAPPPTDRLQLELEVDLLRASALTIVPFGEGEGSVAVAVRRSYYELLLPLVTEDVMLSYADYQVRLDYRLHSRLRMSVFFFGSRDSLETTDETGVGATTGSQGIGFHYGLDQVIATLEWKASDEAKLRWSGTIGPSSVEIEAASTGDPSLGTNTGAMRLGQRFEATYAASRALETTVGLDESIFLYDVEGSFPSIAELPNIPAPEPFREALVIRDRVVELGLAPYVQQVFRPDPVELTLGLRADYFEYGATSVWVFDPRSVVRVAVTDPLTLKAATGLFAQPPLPYQTTRVAVSPKLDPSRAWQNSVGLELELPASFEIDTTVFYNHMWQLARASGAVDVDAQGRISRPFFDDDGRGRAYGYELMLRRRAEQGFFGWLSYTLSRSERFLDGGDTVLFFFDQTHVLNLAMSYAVDGWTFGARFTLASGRPVADLLDTGEADVIYDADEDDLDPERSPGRTRLPLYHQLDVRVDRAFTTGPIEGSVFLDIMNAYNAPNSEGYRYQYDFRRRGRLPGIPFLPTIGVRGVLR
jgi:hypothetical protein